MTKRLLLLSAILLCACGLSAAADETSGSRIGYYRQPALHDTVIVFVAEGDLWKVGLAGGLAQRLTTHPGAELQPAFSPDGRQIAFSATYEGPSEAYVMPLAGGLPKRLTFLGDVGVVGWSPDGRVLVRTRSYSTLPDRQLVLVNPETLEQTRVPLAQAADGAYDESGRTLFFNRFPFQGSYTKRYKGGTAQNVWRFGEGDKEAVNLTPDYPGTDSDPMWYRGRVYFVSDRDGTLNLWSMRPDGTEAKQHTSHRGWDVKDPSISNGLVVYQLGADLHMYDIASATDRQLSIALASDFDQLREKWVTKPIDYLSAASVSPDGDRVAITARGQVFVAPVKDGRFVEVTRKDGVRYRDVGFLPGGDTLIMLSDESGEVEFWLAAADGMGSPTQLTRDGDALRFGGYPSPDGKRIAFSDKASRLWLIDRDANRTKKIDSSHSWGFSGLTWSPDSRWLAFCDNTEDEISRVFVYDTEAETTLPVTGERYEDFSPAWSADGKWLYFLSQRNFNSISSSPWTALQPFPFLDKKTVIFGIALQNDLRSPFEPAHELVKDTEEDEADEGKGENGEKKEDSLRVEIDFDGIQQRLIQVPVPAGNYTGLTTVEGQLLWLSSETASGENSLQTIELKFDDPEVTTLMEGVRFYSLSADGKQIMLRKGDDLHVFEVGTSAPADQGKTRVDLSGWAFRLDPHEEWRQMYFDAWRLERDYFYDPDMHGVDWEAVRDKYLPLVDRITDRDELDDILGEMVSELSALHIFVSGGDHRKGPDEIKLGALGAVLVRESMSGGYRVDHIYRTDPEEPDLISPLAGPGVSVHEGDFIVAVNGVSLKDAEIGDLLRHKAGKQVRLTVRPADAAVTHDEIVEPISTSSAWELRYREWEYTRRLAVEAAGDNQIGYVHLRAMGREDYAQWARDFFPVLKRQGLIVDVRHNNGGNIDSWILTSLLRKPWLYWQSRDGRPYPNMQSSFNGHIVVLCNEWTASDGEMFAEGIRRLGLGAVIGTRTWGGEIWLSYGNRLVDDGIASAAESGAFGPEGKWLIEGHGVDPEVVVDNLPHATFNGEDAQLQAAISYLKRKIQDEPVIWPKAPEYPDKSFRTE